MAVAVGFSPATHSGIISKMLSGIESTPSLSICVWTAGNLFFLSLFLWQPYVIAPKIRRMHPAIAPIMIAAKKTVLRPEREREGRGEKRVERVQRRGGERE